MKLSDISHGPDWVIWVVFAIFTVMSVTLLLGHGSFLISGYNAASKEEKEKYDEKKLCRVMGAGMGVISVLCLMMGLFEEVLPAGFVNIAGGIIIADCLIVILASNTVCRKK